jgi:hypothetical protein
MRAHDMGIRCRVSVRTVSSVASVMVNCMI